MQAPEQRQGRSPTPIKVTGPAASSDYGDDEFDDEFDDDTIMQLEASMTATQTEMEPQPKAATPKNTLQGEVDDKLDEFEDLDDDIFNEAEDFITTDSQQVPQALTTKTDDLDEDFGDVFEEDFDFEAVELAATQAAQNCSGDVRRTT